MYQIDRVLLLTFIETKLSLEELFDSHFLQVRSTLNLDTGECRVVLHLNSPTPFLRTLPEGPVL